MMRVAFAINTRDKSIVPGLISLVTHSPAYHCELVFSDQQAITAQRDGVHFIKRQYDWYGWTALPIPWVNWTDENQIRAKANNIAEKCSPLGSKAYDFVGALLGHFQPRWENPTKWYCSELICYLLHLSTPCIDTTRWYSPGLLWKVLSDYLNLVEPKYMDICSFRYFTPKPSKTVSEDD